MNLKVIASLILVLFGSTANSAIPALAPKKTVAAKQALSIRGGAGPLDPALTAKVFLGICGIQGAYDCLAPKKSFEWYGVIADDTSILCTGIGGGLLLGWVVTAYGVLFADMPPLKAIGVGQLPTIVESLRTILNGDAIAAGANIPGRGLSNLAIVSFTAYACLSDQAYATTAVKAFAIYVGLTTTHCRLAPNSALKLWGIEESKQSPVAIFTTKVMGHLGFQSAIFMLALANNIDAYKALGYSLISSFLSYVLFMASGDFGELDFDIRLAYPWILSVLATVITFAF